MSTPASTAIATPKVQSKDVSRPKNQYLDEFVEAMKNDIRNYPAVKALVRTTPFVDVRISSESQNTIEISMCGPINPRFDKKAEKGPKNHLHRFRYHFPFAKADTLNVLTFDEDYLRRLKAVVDWQLSKIEEAKGKK